MIDLGPAATTFVFPGGYDGIDALYQERGWTDGLPIVPPTEARVREFLGWTDREPREVVAVLPPRQGEATVERIAANAVMAGCRPDYLPVVLTAIEALADPLFNLDSLQATTHPVAPLVVINGGKFTTSVKVVDIEASTGAKYAFNLCPNSSDVSAENPLVAGVARGICISDQGLATLK